MTFLGFGLSPEQPAIGVILSESMRYLTTGKWWLALFPGLALVLVVLLFAGMGERLRRLLDPASAQDVYKRQGPRNGIRPRLPVRQSLRRCARCRR